MTCATVVAVEDGVSVPTSRPDRSSGRPFVMSGPGGDMANHATDALLYAGIMPTCDACLDDRCGECPDLMWSDVFGLYACGREEH